MRDSLAERLLAQVMGWNEIELAQENPDLQTLSEYKYDEYQQFFPGMRFIESLSLWLNQFDENDKSIAYEFVKTKTIFISIRELNHIIRMAYDETIKPYLIKQISDKTTIEEYFVNKILKKDEFKMLKRQSLFLGLSDGAQTDYFRRVSKLSHEQVYSTYMIAEVKSDDLLDKLSRDLKELKSDITKPKFKTIFLLDDFSASGISYIRKEDGEFVGKIAKFLKEILDEENEIAQLINISDLKICVVLYLATKKALGRIKLLVDEMMKPQGIEVDIKAVHEIDELTILTEDNLGDFLKVLKKYYDPKIETPSYVKGKHDNPYLGFDECGLPIILSHNTPNNSLPILWFDPEQNDFRGLFPRVQRFKGTES